MIKFISYASIVIGLLVVIGAAGDDCGGDCIERAMPLADLMLMVAIGLGMMVAGIIGVGVVKTR